MFTSVGFRIGGFMWSIEVQRWDAPEWALIWRADGGRAERDARIRFGQLRGVLAGFIGRAENVHALEWRAVRLVRDDIVIEEHSTQDSYPAPSLASNRPTIPPMRET